MVEIADVGCDWLTATTRDDKVAASWWDIFANIVRRDSETRPEEKFFWSTEVKSSKRMMYDGKSYNGNFWGRSERQGYIMIVSGSDAKGTWGKIAPSARKVSRYDLQVTVRLPAPVRNLGTRHYEARPETEQRKYAFIQNSRGGNTLYVGARTSAYYGRVYDKSALDGGQPGTLWRYEVECKQRVRNLPSLLRLYDGQKLEPRADEIMSFVWGWFKARGVSPIFSNTTSARVKVEEAGAKVTSVDRKLAWLSSQVRPTVTQLVEAGLGKQVMDSLGLGEIYQPSLFDKVKNKE